MMEYDHSAEQIVFEFSLKLFCGTAAGTHRYIAERYSAGLIDLFQTVD
jgi:hypothetical protein